MSNRGAKFTVTFAADDNGQIVATFGKIDSAAEATQKRIKQAGTDWEEFGRKIGTAMRWAGAAVVAGIGLIIKNTIDAERELAQLDAVLKSTGQTANFSRDQLVGMADAIAKASTFSAGEIVKAETRLLSYAGIASEKFPQALQIAIDQAARLGMSVEQSAEIVGRALESPTKAAAALAQQDFGASFTKSVRDGIEALVDAGREAEAQQVILDILSESYGGAAQAARDTFGGALIALKNTLNDLMTGSGGSLEGATASVNDLIDTLNDPGVKSGFDAIVSGAASVAAELAADIGFLADYIAKINTIRGFNTGDLKLGNANYSQLQTRAQALALNNSLLNDGVIGKLKAVYGGQSTLTAGDIGAIVLGQTDAVVKRQKSEIQNILRQQQAVLRKELNDRVVVSDGSTPIPEGMLKALPPPKPVTDPKGGGRRTTTRQQLSEEDREAQRLKQTYDSLLLSMQEREFMLGKTGEVAKVTWLTEYGALKDIPPELKKAALAQAELTDAKDKAFEQQEEQTRLNERLLEDAKRMQDDYLFEIELLGKTREQQELLTRARQLGAAASTEQGQAALAAVAAYQEQAKSLDMQVDLMDEVRGAGKELFMDVANGRADIDSLRDAWDRVHQKILSMIADNLIEKLFGQRGSAAGGSTGGWLGSLMGSLFGSGSSGGGSGAGWLSSIFGGSSQSSNPWGAFAPNQAGFSSGASSGSGSNWLGSAVNFIAGLFGGGRAMGGDVSAGRFYRVNEARPELLTIGGNDFLMMGTQSGRVSPQFDAGGPVNQEFHYHIQGKLDKSTRGQLANDTGRDARRAMVRTGGRS